MDTNFQIQSLKSQLESIKLQMDNIEMQNNNLMMSNPIGQQLFLLSMQLFNAGIQAFNTGKIMYKINDKQKFYEQLRKISEQINSLINENEIQQIPQPTLIQQQGLIPPTPINQMNTKIIIFQNSTIGITTNIRAVNELTMEELFKKYVNEVYGETKKKISFFYDSNKIRRDDKRKIKEVFNMNESPTIFAVETGFMPK